VGVDTQQGNKRNDSTCDSSFEVNCALRRGSIEYELTAERELQPRTITQSRAKISPTHREEETEEEYSQVSDFSA